jgi:apolipoprotein N-acyltransferase
MVRCGNNGGSLLVLPTGEITQIINVPGAEKRRELRRGRGIANLSVQVPKTVKSTFFVRHGEWFVWVLGVGCGVWILWVSHCFVRRKKFFLRQFETKEI